MKNKHSLLLPGIYILVFLTSCKKDDVTREQEIQQEQKFAGTTTCTTYNPNGTVLQTGTPYTYQLTLENSKKPNYDYHFLNLTGDSDTTVYAIKIGTSGNFNIPQQPFRTSNGSNLSIVGQGTLSLDSLIYSWSFYFSPTYKSHDCICKAKKI